MSTSPQISLFLWCVVNVEPHDQMEKMPIAGIKVVEDTLARNLEVRLFHVSYRLIKLLWLAVKTG